MRPRLAPIGWLIPSGGSWSANALQLGLHSASAWRTRETWQCFDFCATWRAHHIRNLLPPGNVSCGNGINSGGTICGHSFVAENGTAPHAFLANSALVLTDLGTGDDYSVAFDVNDQGVVTGETTRGVSDFSACLWTPTGIRDIGTLGGNRSVGRSINETNPAFIARARSPPPHRPRDASCGPC